jgi:hypothetical protein
MNDNNNSDKKPKYKSARRIKEPAHASIKDWITAYQRRRDNRPTMLGAVARAEETMCAIAMISGNVVAMPLNRGVVPEFLAMFNPKEQASYQGWVQAFQEGKIRMPEEQVSEDMLLF